MICQKLLAGALQGLLGPILEVFFVAIVQKITSILSIFLVLSFLTVIFPRVCMMATSGTIYIRPDGSVDPPTSPIQRDGDIYTFTSDIFEEISVMRHNAIVDGNGYTLQGPGASYSPIAIGIITSGVTNVTIKNTNIRDFYHGIYTSASNTTICGNNITNNHVGLYILSDACNNSILSNNIVQNNAGISLYDSPSYNKLSANSISENIEAGIELGYHANFNSVFGNNITNNGNGIEFYVSSNNAISENLITGNGKHGISLTSSSNNNSIIRNDIARNTESGIDLAFSEGNIMSENDIQTNNWDGIRFDKSSYNTVFGNNISNSLRGVYLIRSLGNRFYCNNFRFNTNHVLSAQFGSNYSNFWTGGYASLGNYWDVYAGADANSDGVGETPYIIDANNQDQHPLMAPYQIPEFPSFLILSLFMIATLLAVIVYKRKHEIFKASNSCN